MAEHVLGAIAPLVAAVVCDDPEVAEWAVAHGALLLEEPGLGLNGAVTAGVDALAAAGAEEVLVVHADLPLASGLARLAGLGGVTLVPDRRDDGTNVALCALSRGVPFQLRSRIVRAPLRRGDQAGVRAYVSCASPFSRGTWTSLRTFPQVSHPDTTDERSRTQRGAAVSVRSGLPVGDLPDGQRQTNGRPRRSRLLHSQSGHIPTTSSSAAAGPSPSGPQPDAACTISSSPTDRKEPGTLRRHRRADESAQVRAARSRHRSWVAAK